MVAEKLNKKDVIIEAQQLLKQGISKQETFEILKEKYKFTKDVSDMLKNLPSQQAIQKYGKWNYVLLILLISTAILFLLESLSILILLWYGLQIYAVTKMLIKYYSWVSVFSSITLISFIGLIFTNEIPNPNWRNTILLMTLSIPTLIIPLWLENKLCPKPTERMEKYTNSEGQQRLRIVYEFNE